MCVSADVTQVTCFTCLCFLVIAAMCSGRLLRCACNTQHCRSTRSHSCTTQYKCFTQYLEKSDGSNPLTTGCISGNTPLLCENRLPAVTRSNWPYLVCCDSGHMCNHGAVMPSPPPWLAANMSSVVTRPHNTTQHMLQLNNPITSQPIVMAVLVVGLFLLVVITAVGFYVLKSQSSHMQQASTHLPHIAASGNTARASTVTSGSAACVTPATLHA